MVLHDYLHAQPKHCKVLRFQALRRGAFRTPFLPEASGSEVAEAVKAAVEAEKAFYKSAYRTKKSALKTA